MLITILYSLWIAYTVGSLSLIGLLTILSILGKIERKRIRKKLDELYKLNSSEYEDEGW
jgi:hypothetical protein